MRIHLLFLSLIYALSLNAQVLSINIPENTFGIDESKFLIVSQVHNISDYSSTNEYNEINIFFGGDEYKFNTIPDSLSYTNSYLVTKINTSNQYTLYLTPLPIVSINSDTEIVDEPKVLGHFTYSDEEQVIESNIGIELRGGGSQNYPKKTYDLEFWEDTEGNETNNVQFGNLRSDDDWILDALYNEPLRLRSYIANKLWLKMHTPGYISDEPNAKAGANVMYVEMFLNNQYNGVYNLSEQIDKKQLKLKSYNDNIRGELYKGVSWGEAVTFSGLPDYDNTNREWGGYEYKYPKESDITDWSMLYQFTDFVINSSETDFTDSIWNKFDESNFIDYFLFLNLLRATDNTGKNLYIAKYKANRPYFYVPWDLDGCFGTIWDGTNENITNTILTNGFIDKVIDLNPNNTIENIKNQWLNYRNNIFNRDSLSNTISEQYNFLSVNKIYEREALVYSNYPFNNEDLSYTLTWLDNRLSYLDFYFTHSLSTDTETYTTTVQLYPNPAENLIYINSQENLIGENFKIYNSLGQLVLENTITSSSISIESLNRGAYFIVINNKSYKLIKN